MTLVAFLFLQLILCIAINSESIANLITSSIGPVYIAVVAIAIYTVQMILLFKYLKPYIILSTYYATYFLTILLGVCLLDLGASSSELNIQGYASSAPIAISLSFNIFFLTGYLTFISFKNLATKISEYHPKIASKRLSMIYIIWIALTLYITLIYGLVGFSGIDRALFLRSTDIFKFEAAAVLQSLTSAYIFSLTHKNLRALSYAVLGSSFLIWFFAGEKFTRFIFLLSIALPLLFISGTMYYDSSSIKKSNFRKFELLLALSIFSIIVYATLSSYYSVISSDISLIDNIVARASLQGQLEWLSFTDYLSKPPPFHLQDFMDNEVLSISTSYGYSGKSLLQRLIVPNSFFKELLIRGGYFAGGFPSTFYLYFYSPIVPLLIIPIGAMYGYLSYSLYSDLLTSRLASPILVLVDLYMVFYKFSALLLSGDFRSVLSPQSIITFFLYYIIIRPSILRI